MTIRTHQSDYDFNLEVMLWLEAPLQYQEPGKSMLYHVGSLYLEKESQAVLVRCKV